MVGLLKRAWIPLVLLLVAVIAGFTVDRIRGFFGSEGVLVTQRVFSEDPESFDPKVVRYEVFGSGTSANINFLDLDAKPQRVDDAGLPWSITLETNAPSAAPNIIAQGDGMSITCRIVVDDVVKDERTVTGVEPLTFCFLKSA